jgi:hypothetical protein
LIGQQPLWYSKPRMTDVPQMTRAIQCYADERLTGLKCVSGAIICVPKFPKTGFKINRRRSERW